MNDKNITAIECIINFLMYDQITIIENGQVVEIRNEE